MNEIIKIKDFSFTYNNGSKAIRVLKNIDLSIFPGEAVGLVGESGSGKSSLAKAILRIPDFKYTVKYEGNIFYDNVDLLNISDRQLNRIRGKEISIVFQDPLSYLNPVVSIHRQIKEILVHHDIAKGVAADEMIEQELSKVQFEDPKRVMESYPFELSGGMRQRVVICMALITRPKLLVADEVTSSLDVLVESSILENINNLRTQYNTSVLLISHNLPMISKYADRIAIIYAGRIMEILDAEDARERARHPYTRALFSCALAEINDGVFPYIEGSVPSVHDDFPGCPYFSRKCPNATQICADELPEMLSDEKGFYRCHNLN